MTRMQWRCRWVRWPTAVLLAAACGGMSSDGCSIQNLGMLIRSAPSLTSRPVPGNPLQLVLRVELAGYPETRSINWKFGDGSRATNLSVASGREVMDFYGREGTFTVEAYLFDGRGARVATASADVVASLPDATTDEPPDDTTDVPPDDTTDVPPDNTNDEPPTNNRVRLRTNLGDIVLEMLVDAAPGTVANFRQYVRDGHYNGVVFHRVVPNFVIQGGAFTSLGVGADPRLTEIGTRPPIASEANNGFSNVRGTVAMALRGQDADSGTDQFFINLVDNTFLDTGPPPFTVFARVVEGMLVVDRIGGVATGSFNVLTTNGPSTFEDVPVEDVTVLSATEE